MKKLLLSTAAIATLAVAAPAFAGNDSGVKLDVGGGISVFGVWVDSEAANRRDFDMVRDTEVHFTGETTLDNGLTVGAHIETGADRGDGFAIDESYLYMSGSWGRVNVGSEDGAAYLLQVAAPSALPDFDGVRQEVSPFNDSDLRGGYDQDVSGKDDKFTYLTPVFSGFQAGVSYTTEQDASSRSDGTTDDTNSGERGDTIDLAVRYEGQYDSVGVTAGAGYTNSSGEAAATEDRKAWNAGLDLDIGAFGVGVVYTKDDQGTANDDETQWVLGADYTTGPFTLGASYLNRDETFSADSELDRYAGGVSYAYGPGMTFRGVVTYADFDEAGGTSNDTDETAVMLGTQVNF